MRNLSHALDGTVSDANNILLKSWDTYVSQTKDEPF